MHVKVAKIPGKFPGKLLSRFRFVEIARSHSHDVPLKVSLLDSSIICPNGVISFASIIFTEQISPAASQRTDLPQSRKLLLHLSYWTIWITNTQSLVVYPSTSSTPRLGQRLLLKSHKPLKRTPDFQHVLCCKEKISAIRSNWKLKSHIF